MNMIRNDNNPNVDAFAKASTSSILSPVVTRDLKGIGVDGFEEPLPVDGFVGTYTVRDGEPQFLGIVSDSYEVIQMRDLVTRAEQAMKNVFSPDQLDSVEITDRSGGGGAFVERSYTVKAFEEALTYGNTTARTLTVGTTVAAQMRLRTGYDGGTRTSLASGCLDLVCNNGMVAMTLADLFAKKHTSGATIEVFESWIETSMMGFSERVDQLRNWTDSAVTWSQIEAAVKALPSISERRAEQLLQRMQVEVQDRGLNFYAVVSGLTFYASHNSDEFPVRQTGNDNVAATLANREVEVARWINSAPLQELIAA